MGGILALEITENKIKILEVMTTGEGLQPLRLDTIDLPANSVKDGIIVEPKLISDRLAVFLKANKIFTKSVVALINPPYVFTRLIRLPQNLSNSHIRLNLEAEINQYKTFSGKEKIIDFRKIEEISEEGVQKMNLIFGATLKALTNSYLKTLELAGLDLIGVDVPILSTIRLLDEADFKSSSLDVSLLILMGDKFIEMCIVKGNRPRYLHFVEIEMYDFQNDREKFIERVVSAIKLVVNFYQVRFIQGEQITRILIHPLDKKYDQIHTLLQPKLPQVPIQQSSPLNKIHIDKDKIKDPDELRFAYPCLLGTILRLENKDRPYNLNFLQEQRLKMFSHLIQVRLLFISLATLLITIIISLSWFLLRINFLQRRLHHLTLKTEEPDPELKEALVLKERKDVLDRQLREAEIIIRGKDEVVYFKNIAKAMVLAPQDLWLTDITLEKETKYLVLTGKSRTEKYLFEYISGLTNSGYFSSIKLLSSEAQIDTINFIIRCVTK